MDKSQIYQIEIKGFEIECCWGYFDWWIQNYQEFRFQGRRRRWRWKVISEFLYLLMNCGGVNEIYDGEKGVVNNWCS